MNNPAATDDTTLLFEWAPPKGEKLLITLFLIGSLFLHALAFYMFRIIYPPTIAVLPPPARVNLIPGNSEEGQTLLRWIEAEDPALASATLRPPDSRLRALPKLAHLPSYIVQEPKLKDAPPWNLTPAAKDALPPGPVPVNRNSHPPSWPKVPTRASFSDELKPLGDPRLTPTQFTASTAETPESVRFRIGVSGSGEVRYCFRLSSSGDSALDEQARQWLVRSRFTNSNAPDAQTLTWGIAMVEWGNDVTQAARAATPTTP
jgi:hypothetical protein